MGDLRVGAAGMASFGPRARGRRFPKSSRHLGARASRCDGSSRHPLPTRLHSERVGSMVALDMRSPTFHQARLLSAFALAAAAFASTTGCELIASVDRNLIAGS